MKYKYQCGGYENGEFVTKGVFNTQKEALDLAKHLNRHSDSSNYDWSRFPVADDCNEETIEEAGERLLNLNELDSFRDYHYIQELQSAFNQGVKWHKDNSNVELLQFEIATLKSLIQDMDATLKSKYSEEEVLVLLHKRDKHSMDKSLTFSSWQTPKEWFEKIKTKQHGK